MLTSPHIPPQAPSFGRTVKTASQIWLSTLSTPFLPVAGVWIIAQQGHHHLPGATLAFSLIEPVAAPTFLTALPLQWRLSKDDSLTDKQTKWLGQLTYSLLSGTAASTVIFFTGDIVAMILPASSNTVATVTALTRPYALTLLLDLMRSNCNSYWIAMEQFKWLEGVNWANNLLTAGLGYLFTNVLEGGPSGWAWATVLGSSMATLPNLAYITYRLQLLRRRCLFPFKDILRSALEAFKAGSPYALQALSITSLTGIANLFFKPAERITFSTINLISMLMTILPTMASGQALAHFTDQLKPSQTFKPYLWRMLGLNAGLTLTSYMTQWFALPSLTEGLTMLDQSSESISSDLVHHFLLMTLPFAIGDIIHNLFEVVAPTYQDIRWVTTSALLCFGLAATGLLIAGLTEPGLSANTTLLTLAGAMVLNSVSLIARATCSKKWQEDRSAPAYSLPDEERQQSLLEPPSEQTSEEGASGNASHLPFALGESSSLAFASQALLPEREPSRPRGKTCCQCSIM